MNVNWVGHFCYNLEFDENEKFQFRIDAAYENGSFTGEFSDEEFTSITGEKGTVKGFIDNAHISFVKKYPFQYDELEDGTLFFDMDSEGHEVVYDGYFNEETGCWEGEWEILIEEIKLNEDESELIFDRGSWKMKRVSGELSQG